MGRKLNSLYIVHEEIVKEMKSRGYNHDSPLEVNFAIEKDVQKDFVDTLQDQIKILKTKNCACKV